MISFLGFNGAILAFFGITLVSCLWLFIQKTRQFKAFDQSSEPYLQELYQALGALKVAEIEDLCKKEGSPLAHLTLELLLIKDQFTQINTLEDRLIQEKRTLEQSLDWFKLSAWLCPIFGIFASLYEMSLLFTQTERVLQRAEIGPKAIAFHILICLAFIVFGLGLSILYTFLMHNLKMKARNLIDELELSGEEIIGMLKEVRRN